MSKSSGNGWPDFHISGAFADVSGPSDGRRTPPAPKPRPFSLRLTAEERARLEAEAGPTPLGSYIRAKLLDGTEAPRRAHRRPVKDDQALAQVLSKLGDSRLASNLNQLAKAANTGSLPVTAETLQAIMSACQDIRLMRACLMAALGLQPERGGGSGHDS